MKGQAADDSSPYPKGWLSILVDEVDFDRAFASLEGRAHFHAETLRGKIRSFQLRLDEAAKHFRAAERLRRVAPRSPKNAFFRFFLRSYAFENALFRFGRDPTEENSDRVDDQLRRLAALPGPDLPVTVQIRLTLLAAYQVLQRDYAGALETFEALIGESSDRLEDQQITFFLGAAIAARELGRVEEADRHYESAVLALDTITQPLKVALFLAKFHALAHHWGRLEEAEEWLDRLRRVPCPEPSRQVMVSRATFLVEAATRTGGIFIA